MSATIATVAQVTTLPYEQYGKSFGNLDRDEHDANREKSISRYADLSAYELEAEYEELANRMGACCDSWDFSDLSYTGHGRIGDVLVTLGLFLDIYPQVTLTDTKETAAARRQVILVPEDDEQLSRILGFTRTVQAVSAL